MTRKSRGGKLQNVRRETEIGALFVKARSHLNYRQVEELIGVNHETWRCVEIGKIKEPYKGILEAAARLNDDVSYDDLRAAIERDRAAEFRAKYDRKEEPRTEAAAAR